VISPVLPKLQVAAMPELHFDRREKTHTNSSSQQVLLQILFPSTFCGLAIFVLSQLWCFEIFNTS
jgi:cytochrome bd-type quinol oxidase subunit 2